jgi:hypothetical protein
LRRRASFVRRFLTWRRTRGDASRFRIGAAVVVHPESRIADRKDVLDFSIACRCKDAYRGTVVRLPRLADNIKYVTVELDRVPVMIGSNRVTFHPDDLTTRGAMPR